MDPAFARDGRELIGRVSEDVAYDVAVQLDQKTIVSGEGGRVISGGSSTTPPRGSYTTGLLARLRSDGSLDPTFSGDGWLDFGGGPLVVQDDGKILVGGRGAVNRYYSAEPPANGEEPVPPASERCTDEEADSVPADSLIRLNPDGSCDLGFAEMGRAEVEGELEGMALQPDGKVVVAGTVPPSVAAPDDLVVSRFNPNGSPDTTFAGDGSETIDLGGAESFVEVLIQDDGRVVLVGSADQTEDLVVVRFLPDGTLDPSYASAGISRPSLGGTPEGAELDDSGKLVVAATGRARTADFLVARYLPDGRPDRRFSQDGKARVDFGKSDSASDIAIQARGRLLVAGTAKLKGGDFGYALAMLKPSGKLDRAFSEDGRVRTRFTETVSGSVFAAALAIGSNGRVVVAGESGGDTSSPGGCCPSSIALARYK